MEYVNTYLYSPSTKTQKLCQLAVDSYTGRGGFEDGKYLIEFFKEDGEDFAKRVDYSEYSNVVKPAIESIVNPIFSQKRSLEFTGTNKQLLEAFVKDADHNGNGLFELMKQIETYHQITDNVFVIFDMPKGETEEVTVTQATEQKRYPYMYFKLPTEVKQYKTDEFGNLTEIDFIFEYITDDDGKEIPLYKHIDSEYMEDYIISNTKRTSVKKFEHKFGCFPVLMTGTEVIPTPNILSPAQMSALIYNQNSELRTLERSQSYNTLVMPGIASESEILLGANGVLWVDPDSSQSPGYISPDSNVNKTLMESIQNNSEKLDNMLQNMGAIPIVESGKSGAALAYEFAGNSNVLVNNVKHVIATIEKILNMVLKLLEDNNTTYELTIDSDFNPSHNKLIESKNVILEVLKDGNLSEGQIIALKERLVDIVTELVK